ncbi:MAG: WYL domain-containing protein [Blastochloris sp.]|nr:WYL domain-containing protein [Blastochloris sp.]
MPGDRGSEWHVVARCGALLRRLLRGEASTDELIAVIRAHDADDTPQDQLSSRLEADLKRLRERMGCQIDYIRTERVYRLTNLEGGLIDLSDEALDGLAFLNSTFAPSDIPQRDAVLRLLNEVTHLLPNDRQHESARRRVGLEIDLRSRDSSSVDPELLEKLTYACSAHHEIEFLYRSPSQADEQPRRHRVEPMRCYLEPTRRHYRLEAFCLEINGPNGVWAANKVMDYRLERMSEVHRLPKRFVPRTRRAGVEVVYVLSANLARLRDVTGIVEDSHVIYEPDGRATIHMISHNLLMDLKTLLAYGAECQVIGGEAAVREMRTLVQGLAALY